MACTRSDRPEGFSRELYLACISHVDSTREDGYRTLYGYLLRAARYVAGRCSTDDYEYLVAECCQNALIKIHRSIADCRSADSFLGWCSTIVRREMYDLWRTENSRSVLSLDKPLAIDDSMTWGDTLRDDQRENPGADLEHEELWRYLVEGAKTHFSPVSKEIILGGYLLGKNDRELARENGITPGYVTVIRFRDFEKLRKNPDFMQRFDGWPTV